MFARLFTMIRWLLFNRRLFPSIEEHFSVMGWEGWATRGPLHVVISQSQQMIHDTATIQLAPCFAGHCIKLGLYVLIEDEEFGGPGLELQFSVAKEEDKVHRVI